MIFPLLIEKIPPLDIALALALSQFDGERAYPRSSWRVRDYTADVSAFLRKRMKQLGKEAGGGGSPDSSRFLSRPKTSNREIMCRGQSRLSAATCAPGVRQVF